MAGGRGRKGRVEGELDGGRWEGMEGRGELHVCIYVSLIGPQPHILSCLSSGFTEVVVTVSGLIPSLMSWFHLPVPYRRDFYILVSSPGPTVWPATSRGLSLICVISRSDLLVSGPSSFGLISPQVEEVLGYLPWGDGGCQGSHGGCLHKPQLSPFLPAFGPNSSLFHQLYFNLNFCLFLDHLFSAIFAF